MPLSGAARGDSGWQLCGVVPVTRRVCPPKPSCSGAPSAALRFVVVLGIKIDSAECLEDFELVAPLNVLGEGCGDRVFLGFVMTHAAGLFDQFVVESEVGCHVYIITQYSVWIAEILRWEPLATRATPLPQDDTFQG